ncbi:hypothetical protein E2C01_042132 [Portunus trituberculatus]|uniref:Uncharacterized protein n=1 Tax=Portunus trituberculatus TaxID=210409 RepID=A0A5B7FPD7_PORTR|nr:hypothetical protein [Portunus trituberculatus]
MEPCSTSNLMEFVAQVGSNSRIAAWNSSEAGRTVPRNTLMAVSTEASPVLSIPADSFASHSSSAACHSGAKARLCVGTADLKRRPNNTCAWEQPSCRGAFRSYIKPRSKA